MIRSLLSVAVLVSLVGCATAQTRGPYYEENQRLMREAAARIKARGGYVDLGGPAPQTGYFATNRHRTYIYGSPQPGSQLSCITVGAQGSVPGFSSCGWR
jgi:hypothetical protein